MTQGQPRQLTEIAGAYPFDPHYLTVCGHRMHYLSEGEGNGDPILFLHGMPTWSYLWRNIVPELAQQGHCLAPDLIGMGRSDKPDINYHVEDHIAHIDAFIEALELTNVTLVMHGWGSVIGFDYAMRHPERIKGLAFYEAHVRPLAGDDSPALPVQQWASILDSPDGGFDEVMNGNYFIDKVLPWGCQYRLTDEALSYYREPFEQPGSCRPLWQYLEDLPLSEGHRPEHVQKIITHYSAALMQSPIPKLMFYAMPGFVTPIATVQWAKEHLPALTIVEIDDALHYAQESHPQEMSVELINWYTNIATVGR